MDERPLKLQDLLTKTHQCLIAIFILLTLCLAWAPTAERQYDQRSTSEEGQDAVEEYPKVQIDELAAKYRKWLTEKVVHIVTDGERDVFLRLPNDDARNRFIARFWKIRDPTPATSKNEYRQMHFKRLEEANRLFGRTTSQKGSLTDRGRVYVLLGEPLRIDRFPQGRLTYPLEVWWYQGVPVPGLPSAFNLIFYRAHGAGEYRLYNPVADGPRDLLNAAGDQLLRSEYMNQDGLLPRAVNYGSGTEAGVYQLLVENVDPQLARAAISLVPGESGSSLFGRPSLSSQVLLGKIQKVPDRLMPSSDWALSILHERVEAEVQFGNLAVSGVAVPIIHSEAGSFLHYAIQLNVDQLESRVLDGNEYYMIEMSGSISSTADGTVVRELRPRSLQHNVDGGDAAEASSIEDPLSSRWVIWDRLPILSGDYEFTVTIVDKVSRKFGSVDLTIHVPQLSPWDPMTTQPLLASRFRRLDTSSDRRSQIPFSVDGNALFPSADRGFATDDKLIVFHQVYVPPSLEEPTNVRYRVERAGIPVYESSEALESKGSKNGRLIDQAVTIPLTGLSSGNYVLSVDVEGASIGPYIEKFTIRNGDDRQPQRYVHVDEEPPARHPSILVDLARQASRQNDYETTIRLLKSALGSMNESENDAAPKVMLELARAYEASDNVERCREVLVDLLEEHPGHPAAQEMLDSLEKSPEGAIPNS